MMKRLRADGDMQPNGDLVGYALALQGRVRANGGRTPDGAKIAE
jgi:hypothetical protein